MPKSSPGNNVAPRWPLVLMLLLSAALHAAFGAFVLTALEMPELDIEFQLPMDVQFGLTDEVEAAATVPAGSSPAPSEPEPASAAKTAAEAQTEPAAPAPEPKREPKPERPAQKARSKANDLATAAGEEASRLPAGASIGVRVDMSRIRASPIAEDVRALLKAIPDWQALLDGSGIDPVTDLDRFLILTSDFQRSNIMIAGRHTGSDQLVLDAVERLAAAHGENVTWDKRGGLRVAPWANADVTPRVIALVGPAHFTISKPDDLQRLLAVAAHRAEQRRSGKPEASHPADALLAMEADEGLSVEVEGAERFVRRVSKGVPKKLRLSAVELPGTVLQLRGRLTFADVAKAEDGARYWEGLRTKVAGNFLAVMLGLAQPLRDGQIRREESVVELEVTLSVEQARLILGQLRELLAPAPSASPVGGATPPPAGP